MSPYRISKLSVNLNQLHGQQLKINLLTSESPATRHWYCCKHTEAK